MADRDITVEILRVCRWCYWEWQQELDQKALMSIIKKQPIGACPNCNIPT